MEESTLRYINEAIDEMMDIMKDNNRTPTQDNMGIEFSWGWESGYVYAMNELKNFINDAKK